MFNLWLASQHVQFNRLMVRASCTYANRAELLNASCLIFGYPRFPRVSEIQTLGGPVHAGRGAILASMQRPVVRGRPSWPLRTGG